MKKNNNAKLLLVGKLSEIVRNLNECLTQDFQVQLCSEELANVQAMVRIIKPQLIVICQIGMEETDHIIFEFPSARFNPPPLGGQALAAFPSSRNCDKIQH